jgi:hypothetical protein
MTKTKFNSQKLEIYTTETKEQSATRILPNMWNLDVFSVVLPNYDMSNVLPDYDTSNVVGVSWKTENTYPTGASGLSSTYLESLRLYECLFSMSMVKCQGQSDILQSLDKLK